MAQTTQTWFTTTLAKKLLPWDTTMVLATAPTITSWRVKVNVGNNSEWIKFTGLSGSTLTGLVRWLSKTAVPATSGTWLTHPAGTVVKIVIMHDQLLDKQEDETMSWTITFPSIRFSWTTTSWLRLKSLTTTQRDALTPATGDQIFNSTTGTVQTYYGGTWNDNASGTTSNASTTVAGKWQVGTDTQFTNGTLVWSTGATLRATLVQLAKSISLKPLVTVTTPSLDKISVAYSTWEDKSILISDFVNSVPATTSVKWFIKASTTSNTWSMTDSDVAVTPASLAVIRATPSATLWTWTLIASADTWWTVTDATTYTTIHKTITCAVAWTYNFKFNLVGNWFSGRTLYGRIFVNWSPTWTEQSKWSSDTSVSTYSENITVPQWATIELKTRKDATWWATWTYSNFRMYSWVMWTVVTLDS